MCTLDEEKERERQQAVDKAKAALNEAQQEHVERAEELRAELDANSEWDARQSGLPLNCPVKLYRSGISALRSAVSSGWRRVPVLPKIDLS
jgi:hypothetical protein